MAPEGSLTHPLKHHSAESERTVTTELQSEQEQKLHTLKLLFIAENTTYCWTVNLKGLAAYLIKSEAEALSTTLLPTKF